MTIFHSLILGLLEGLTEFLPISSTAHLIIASSWLKIPTSEFLKTFTISIQLGAILAVVILYWKKIWGSFNSIGKIGAAFIPTSIIGLLLYPLIKRYFLESQMLIAWALLLGGLILIIFEKYHLPTKDSPEDKKDLGLSYKQAVIIGVFQSLAIIPGVSRAAATIIGGLGLGIKRKNIVEFSFLLAIPTMLGATGLDLYKSREALISLTTNDLIIWVVGFITAFITAIIGIKFFLKFIQKNNFIPFGVYRLILAGIIFAGILL